jgi:hypothetical protein
MKPIPIFGSGLAAISPAITAQRRLNCFFEVRQDGDKTHLAVLGTFGLLLWITLPTMPVRGWWEVNSVLYIVGGKALYKVTSAGTITQLGLLSSVTGNVAMSDNAVQILIVDGTAGYILTLATGVLTVIVDGNFPNGAETCTFLNGRFIVEKFGTRQFYVSGSYDGTLWTPVIFGTKENSSDKLLLVEAFDGILILWGGGSIEFWQDTGASPLPYQRTSGATQTYGLAAILSPQVINGQTIFLGESPEGAIQVLRLNGYVPERISSSDIEELINSFSVYSDAVALSYVAYGHSLYQLTFPNANRSFLFDANTGIWSEVQTGLGLTGRHLAQLGMPFNAKTLVSDPVNGNIYFFDANTYTDNGAAIKRQCTSIHLGNGGIEMTLSEVQLDMETGVGLQAGQGSDPQISVETSKDGGRTFGMPRLTSLGKVGEYRSPRVWWRRFGKSFDFVQRFTMTDPVKFVIGRAMATLE